MIWLKDNICFAFNHCILIPCPALYPKHALRESLTHATVDQEAPPPQQQLVASVLRHSNTVHARFIRPVNRSHSSNVCNSRLSAHALLATLDALISRPDANAGRDWNTNTLSHKNHAGTYASALLTSNPAQISQQESLVTSCRLALLPHRTALRPRTDDARQAA
jgi:hypothetical protein